MLAARSLRPGALPSARVACIATRHNQVARRGRRIALAVRADAPPPPPEPAAATASPPVADLSLDQAAPEAPPPGSAPAAQAAASDTLQSASWNGSWTKQWYAVGPVIDFDASKPQPFTLLGKHLVLWRTADGSWACLEDRCPHRAVPLSEGKVWSDGTLMCSYHGWRFDESGTCKAIPQAASAEAEAFAAASRRACAVAYPVQEGQGLLFVWGEGGPAAAQESVAAAAPACWLTEQGGEVVTFAPLYGRELPYDYTALVENLADPSHVPFTHHGVQGDRNTQKHGIWDVKKAGPLAAVRNTKFGTVTTTYEPGLLQYVTSPEQGVNMIMNIWLTPIAPGRSKIIFNAVANTSKLPLLSLSVKMMALVPRWADHLSSRNPLFDGDAVFLNAQDRILAIAAAKQDASWRQLYFMPTAADVLVAAIRNWLDTQAGGGPFGSLRDPASPAAKAARAAVEAGAPLGATEADRRVMLDRYQQHTAHCSSCRGALKNVTLLRQVTATAAVVAAAASLLPFLLAFAPAAVAAPAAGAGSAASLLASAFSATWPAGLAAAVLGGATLLLTRLRDAFIFVDYVHAHK